MNELITSINAVLTDSEKNIIIDEIKTNIAYWKDVLIHDPNDRIANNHIDALYKMLNIINPGSAPVNYIHSSGLKFTTERLMSFDEKSSHDISTVCLWLPSCTKDPMVIVGWYCGEPNLEDTKRTADNWMSDVSPAQANELFDLQF